MYFEAFSNRLTNSCCISTGSTGTIGRSSASDVSTLRAPSLASSRVSAPPTISSNGTHSLRATTAPESSLVMSSRFESCRSSRSASSQIVSASSCLAPSLNTSWRSVVAAPVIAASGVRRSCETEDNNELRSCSVFATTTACFASHASAAVRSSRAFASCSCLRIWCVRLLTTYPAPNITANVSRYLASATANVKCGGTKNTS